VSNTPKIDILRELFKNLNMKKTFLKATVSFFTFVFLYLAVAYFWATRTASFALEQYELTNTTEVELSSDQISLLLKIEDPSFWTNNGIDISHDGQGKTTMTQSVVPVLLYRAKLTGWKSGLQTLYKLIWPKFKKIDLGRDIMALAVAKKVSKEKILKIFYEQAYLGHVEQKSVIGLSAAATKYFSKNIQNLSNEEFAGLVGMLKSPDHFNPIKNNSAFVGRQTLVLKVLDGSCLPKGLFDTSYSSCS